VFLEKTDLPHLLHGNTAGSEVGHAAVVKFDADVRNIGCFRHNGHAIGSNGSDLAFYQAENNIDVVDHQVQYHAYLCTPGVELCKAVYLDEHGIKRKPAYGEEGRIEPLNVAYLYFNVRFAGELQQLAGFFHGI